MIAPVLILHIGGGGAALVAGTTAALVRKGQRLHVMAGTTFVVAMLALSVTGFVLAVLAPTRISAVAAALTFYLVATAWSAARRREGTAGPYEAWLLPLAIGCAVASVSFAIQAGDAPTGRLEHLPALAYLPFAGVAILATANDVAFILRPRPASRQRITRHLWRMCTALLIAAFSFFLGQQKVMPIAVRGSPLLVLPPLTVLAVMIFWLVRIRFAGRPFRAGPGAPRSDNASSAPGTV